MLTALQAREILAGCVQALVEDTSERRVALLFAQYPEAAEAVLAYCRGLYRERLEPELAWELRAYPWDIFAILVSFASTAVRRGFLELGLDGYVDGRLGAIICYACKPDELAQVVIDALDGDAEQRERASALAYHTFASAGTAMEPSPGLAALMREKLRLHEREPSRAHT